MTSNHLNYKPKWNILLPSHRPQHGPRPSDEYFRRFHADLVKHNPWNFERAGFYPYGVRVCDDGSQVMFDRSYRPMWSRPGERTIATRADPAQWIEWVGMYFFHDDRPAPEHSKVMQECLIHVMQQFIGGGPLIVRRWKNERPAYMGELVARAPVPPSNVIPFSKSDQEATP